MRTTTLRAPGMAALAVFLATSTGCEVTHPTSSSHSGSASVSPTETAGLMTVRRPSFVGRVQFGRTTWAEDAISGTLLVDGQPITYAVDVALQGTVHASYEDTKGNVVRAAVHADGKRHVRYNGRRIDVTDDGAVSRGAFATLPPSLRAALGIVPLDLACANRAADGRMMEALALPFNLVQRAEPGALTPSDLLPAATCARTSTSADRESLLVHARLVVAPGVADWARGT
jgi:hypothetical protein